MRVSRVPYCVGIALSLALCACGGDDESGTRDDARNVLNRAWQAYIQRDFSRALLEFERTANLDPSLADAHNGIGWTHLSLVDGAPSPQILDEAVASFTTALRADGELADAWVGVAQALFLRRSKPEDFRDAANALASALDANRETLYRHDYRNVADIYALEGWCYYYAGDRDTARDRARRALTTNPILSAASLLDQLAR